MKNIINIIVIAAVVICAVLITKSCTGGKHKAEKAAKEDTKAIDRIQYIIKHDTTEHYIDNAGNTHATKTVITGNEKQLAVFLQGKIDSQAKALGIAAKQIDNLQDELLHATGEIKSHVTAMGNNLYEVPFRDCFLSGYSLLDLNTNTQTMFYDGSIRLHGVRYWERAHHFLFIRWGRLSFKDDIWTDCPNVVIDSVQDIKIVKGFSNN